MITKTICILGGTGFVGRRIASYLTDAGQTVLITTRSYYRQRDLTVLPTVTLVEGDVHEPGFLRRVFSGVDVVINLVGILNERGRSGRGFARVHAELPAKVAEVCQHAGVKRLLHMSALNAAAHAPSHYLRSKAAGEDAVLRAAGADLHATIFRPSVIFGPRDSFTNRFAQLLKLSPGVFPLACPNARFQPVYIEDVARAFVDSIDNHKTFGQRYSLCGPTMYTLRELVAYIAERLGKRVHIIGLNDTLSFLQAAALDLFPGKPFSLDNYRSLQVDSVCTEGFPKVFGLAPTPLESVAPSWLGRARG
jgi:NADH dehydrogenase